MDKDFKAKYPNIAKELEVDDGVKMDGVRSSVGEAEKAARDKYADFDPTALDFLRRCSTDDEGLEIIDYLHKKGEIEKDYASQLKMQLLSKGIRSFGPQKKRGHYLKGI
jgi:hypothetical protein